jgi:hypothetical protein
MKCVCRLWANAARRTVHNTEWLGYGENAATLASVPARYCRYTSAHEAFGSLSAGAILDKRLVTRKCKQLAATHGVHLGPGGTAESVLYNFHRHFALFGKSVRAVQQQGSDKICIFSDVYNASPNVIRLFALKCAAAGFEIFEFEKDYPSLEFATRYQPPNHTKMLYAGYKEFYRGKLIGIVV